MMQNECSCEFLYGPNTTIYSKNKIKEALNCTEETEITIDLYKKDGKINLNLSK